MKQISVRKRIVILVLLLTIVSVGALGFTLFLFQDLEGLAGAVNDSGSERMRTVLLSSFALQSYRTLLEEELDGVDRSATRRELRDAAAEESRIYEEILHDLSTSSWTPEIDQEIQAWSVAWDQFRKDLDEVLQAEERTPAVVQAVDRVDVIQANNLRKDINTIVVDIQNLSDTTLRHISRIFWVIISLVVVLSVMVAVMVRRALLPLTHLSRAVQAFGTGDLSVSYETNRHDEIGSLSRDFMTAAHSTRDLVLQLGESAVEMERSNRNLSENQEESIKAAGAIASVAERTYIGFKGLAGSITNASAAVEEIHAVINGFGQLADDQATAVTQTTAAMEEMSASIHSVNKIAADRVVVSSRLAEVTEEGNNTLRTTVDLIESIGERMDSILAMIGIINKIASQTNLLAMNAAIEAAHAGDSGRGFAVVADEIRNLAESTAKSSGEITRTLKDLVKDTSEVVASSKASGTAFSQIQKGVSDVTDSFTEIRRSMEELAAGSAEVVHASESLSEISSQLQGNASEMRIGAEEVNQLLQEVIGVSGPVQENMEAIKKETARVNLVSGMIGESVVRNLQGLQTLMDRLGRFNISEEHAEQRQKSIEQLNLSALITAHAGWVAKSRSFLDGVLDIDPATLVDHRTCALGQWLHGQEDRKDQPHYHELDTIHRQMHEVLHTIVTGKGRLSTEALEDRYQELVGHSQRIVEILVHIRGTAE